MGIFSEYAPPYRKRGFYPRPIWHQTKACHIRNWPKSDPNFTSRELDEWLQHYASFGIGLLMGSPLPDGTTLGAVDVDHNDYVRVIRTLLRNPISGRVGSKGIAYFVRVAPGIANAKLSVKGEYAREYGQVVECLFHKCLCVIPPTTHPKTGRPYDWVGKPLLEVDFADLPLIGE